LKQKNITILEKQPVFLYFNPITCFLDAFSKLLKVTVSFVISACPSIRMEQLVSQRTDFHELYVWVFFENLSRKFKFIYFFIFLLWRCNPTRVMASSFLRFLDHTQRRTTVGRTPLDEWPARRRDLYLTTHDTHNRKISMLPVGFEPTNSVGERPQTLDRSVTGTGNSNLTRF